ncbi:MAG TPA: ethanolamine utilization cob(I)yrinic acid a,c-diamide adenosyltransferase EutT [Pseudomonadales bacterium]|nr:ethanolamine utilization cob(I)yrinic acid a,c-diamide adenosyltransferase EutT [Pseudomonadales bacterium]
MATFITETWLREHHGLSEGTELHLPADARLTPAARTLISERHLSLKFQDEQGRLYRQVGEPKADGAPQLQVVHGLTSSTERVTANCQLCGEAPAQKPAAMTHLNAHELVAKNDPRLQFRAQLDAAIAMAVWLQVELAEPSELGIWLADIRSVLGQLMRADVLEETLPAYAIAGLDDEALHHLSHAPLKYLGHDHLVPEHSHGRTAALLNLLRAKVREVEIVAAQVFIDSGFKLRRPDLLHALNRLSSAIYVAMLLSVLVLHGKSWPSIAQLQRRLQGEPV